MTRTERNQNPAALLKDRHSRSGLNKNELQRKQGAGAHNWGSFRQEGQYESQADNDIEDEREIFDMEGDGDIVTPMLNVNKKVEGDVDGGVDPVNDVNDVVADRMATANGNDVEGGIKDLAHSPSESMSSLESAEAQNKMNDGGGIAGRQPMRRMSNVSDEERERARVYREGVMNKGGVDLAHIARTSYGIAQSPPNSFSTSPTKGKGVMKPQ